MPAAVPWISVQDMVARFGAKDVEERDLLAMRKACAQACSWVERMQGWRILASTYIRRFDGTGADYLPLPALPIRRIVSLSIDEVSITVGDADAAALNPAVAFHDRTCVRYMSCGSQPSLGWRRGYSVGFPRGKANVRVSWEAGYLADEIPAAILGLTETLAGIFWREKHRVGDKGRSSGRGGSSEYLRELTGADLQAAKGLSDWRMAYVDPGIPLEGDAGSDLGVFQLGDAELG